MVDITSKNFSLRKATAQALVRVGTLETMEAIEQDRVPKGNVFCMAKAAGLFAVKRTSDMIPDCHPLPVEYTDIRYETKDTFIRIEVEVHTVYKTGVEVEAMHAASVVALTMYDMLKPIDKEVSIHEIKLLQKEGGKSSLVPEHSDLKTVLLFCSDAIQDGKKDDQAGLEVIEKLKTYHVSVDDYRICRNDAPEITGILEKYLESKMDLIIILGGTGLGKGDKTPEAVVPYIEKRIPGIEEAMRSYGQQRSPYAMFSRSMAGTCGNSLILVLPGSTRGAAESVAAIFPGVFHFFKSIKKS
ncbi:MAG: bifunctional molybdenum cofactor biosynthesis protein MoaC/MoaB [Cyclobacteriaceae bacterium]|nr:bifunctional molybdenum cofactor biosynthesis protein MoaC/MoaB [Cyclobacteriaceae bacterium]